MASDETFDGLCRKVMASSDLHVCNFVCVEAGAIAMARRAVEMARQRLFNGPTSTEYEAGYNAACGHIIADVAAFAGIEGHSAPEGPDDAR